MRTTVYGTQFDADSNANKNGMNEIIHRKFVINNGAF